MHTMSFEDRAHALENAFFREVDRQLLEKLRRQIAEEELKQALKLASGISNDSLLDELVRIGVRPATLSAVSLIPLVMVAWADGELDQAEKSAILRLGREAGIADTDPSHQLLEHWMSQRPGEQLLEAWQHYVAALRDKLSESSDQMLSEKVLERARKVAKASGGALGVGELKVDYGSVSPSEQRVLQTIKQAVRG